ncbi:MAG: TIGR03663 family protein [Chloroflexi bacterium]|nr:TIGR03663 family protein [Chloroflexota bacterium]
MVREELSPLSSDRLSLLERPLSALLRINWETAAWILLFVLAVVSRFYDLGARAMSHDESLHAVYSLDLYRQGAFQHNPMMHGPFLFHATAFIYGIFGVTDATTRMFPALTGIGAVMMAWFFRRWIGRTGALLAAFMLLISPSLLFHSRYIRNDIFIVFFAMFWVYGMFRYLEDRQVRWLYVMAGGMAFGFIAKENQFMTGVLFGAFVGGLALWRSLGKRAFVVGGLGILAVLVFLFRPHEGTGHTLALAVVGLALLGAAGALVVYLRQAGWRRFLSLPEMDLAVVMLTLVLPFTAPVGYLILPWEKVDWSAPAITNEGVARWALLVGSMTVVAIAVAWYWFSAAERDEEDGSRPTLATWAGLMLFFWAIEIVFFTTFFTNPLRGLATGVVGSLGYWIGQQAVQRGSQPWYYYGFLTLLYEFLPALLTVGGAVAVVRGLLRGQWSVTPSTDLPAEQRSAAADVSPAAAKTKAKTEFPSLLLSPADARLYFVLFLAFWVLGAWVAYSYAGEKMPWLLTHMAEPMAIFGGWWLGSLFSRTDWGEVQTKQGYWVLLLLPALGFALLSLGKAGLPFGGRDVESLGATVRFFLALIASGALLYAGWRWIERGGLALALRLSALGIAAILALLTIRFSYMLTYVNYDMATEYLVYAHSAPDVKRALAEIDTISRRTVGERDIRVAYDDDVAWPMSWYMRFYPNNVFYGKNPSADSMSAPIVLVGSANYSKVEPYVQRDYVSRNYRLVWWPEESYKGEWDAEAGQSKGLTLAQIWGALTDPARRSRLWQIWFYRNHPGETVTVWPHRHEFRMYVRRDIAEIVWDLNVTPTDATTATTAPAFDYTEIDLPAQTVYAGIFDNLPLLQPRDVAVGADGTRYIADTGNNRIVVLDQTGVFVRAFGSTCLLSDGEAGKCVDPDGAGPLALGDGQFREPWGVAVAADGTIFVADTWNGRIQAFDSQGNFLRKWGVFNIIDGDNRDPNALFGPRGLAVTLNGDLLVADTGNKRILEFTPNGEYVNQVGGGGVVLGRFEEPVDVAVDPRTGTVYVADIWNRRIQVLTPTLEPVGEWPVPSWESQDIWDKAYLAVDADGTVYASDPQFSQVYIYTSDGKLQFSFGKYGAELNRFAKPNGLAIDPLDNSLLVADADNNRVLVFAGR